MDQSQLISIYLNLLQLISTYPILTVARNSEQHILYSSSFPIRYGLLPFLPSRVRACVCVRPSCVRTRIRVCLRLFAFICVYLCSKSKIKSVPEVSRSIRRRCPFFFHTSTRLRSNFGQTTYSRQTTANSLPTYTQQTTAYSTCHSTSLAPWTRHLPASYSLVGSPSQPVKPAASQPTSRPDPTTPSQRRQRRPRRRPRPQLHLHLQHLQQR